MGRLSPGANVRMLRGCVGTHRELQRERCTRMRRTLDGVRLVATTSAYPNSSGQHMTLRAKGGRGELRFPECRSQQRTAECVKASLAATWELCELSFSGRVAIPTRGVLGPPLHLIDDPPLFPPRSSCQPLCRAIWSTPPHPSPPRGISILV